MLIQNIFLMFCGHALADFSLQTEWQALNKNRHVRDSFTPEQKRTMLVIWPWLLTAHALVHGLMVYIILQRLDLAIAETVVHWIIDFGKNERWYNFHVDQVLHLITKIVWAQIVYWGSI